MYIFLILIQLNVYLLILIQVNAYFFNPVLVLKNIYTLTSINDKKINKKYTLTCINNKKINKKYTLTRIIVV